MGVLYNALGLSIPTPASDLQARSWSGRLSHTFFQNRVFRCSFFFFAQNAAEVSTFWSSWSRGPVDLTTWFLLALYVSFWSVRREARGGSLKLFGFAKRLQHKYRI